MPEAILFGLRHFGHFSPRRFTPDPGCCQELDASHRHRRCVFCPDCGSRLWHERESEILPTISVKGGSLDQPVDLAAAVHIWISRKLPGVDIPKGVMHFAAEPD